jgi:hypothetical protein
MIISEDPCPTCGSERPVIGVKCDNCGSLHPMDQFKGTVIHFAEGESLACDGDCDNCEEDDSMCSEFHFCGRKCISEYINDPYKREKFSQTEGRGAILIVGPDDVDWLFYALGRCDCD